MLDTAGTVRNFKYLVTAYDTLFWYCSQHNTNNDLQQIIQCGCPEKMAFSISIK